MIEPREFKIIIQNLTNRAVDIEIANAKVDNRQVDFDKIQDNLTKIKTMVGKEIADHENKYDNNKKPYNKFGK